MTRPPALSVALAVCALALPLASCGGDDGETSPTADREGATDTGGADTVNPEEGAGGDRNVNVALEDLNDSGITGIATLSAIGEGRTRVTIELRGPTEEAMPAHVHEGNCDSLDPNPKYPLETVEDGRSESEIEANLDELEADRYAINVHRSEADIETYVACGELAGGATTD